MREIVRRPYTIQVHRSGAGAATYRDRASETVLIDAPIPGRWWVRVLLVLVAIACFLTFGHLPVIGSLQWVVVGAGVILVIYATGPISGGSTRISVDDRALAVWRRPFGRKRSFDARRIVRLIVDARADQSHVIAELEGSTEVLATVTSPVEAHYIAQEVESSMGRRLR